MASKKHITFKQMKNYWNIYLLVIPSMLVVITFAYFPAANAIYHAFYRWNGDNIEEYIGMSNIIKALHDPTLWYGFKVVSILVFANFFKIIPAVMTAVCINRLKNEKWAYIYKVLFVIPMIIPQMVGLLVWKFIFNPNSGALNAILNNTGLMYVLNWIDNLTGLGVFNEGVNPVWLGDVQLVIPSLIMWGFPWVGAVGVLIYLAGLQTIDDSIYESAEIDGINSISKFFYIEFPLILTQVRITIILMIIGTIQSFHLQLILLGPSGGPQGVGMLPGLYMYNQAFVNNKFGYACAIGLLLFVFILILTEINNRFVKVEK